MRSTRLKPQFKLLTLFSSFFFSTQQSDPYDAIEKINEFNNLIFVLKVMPRSFKMLLRVTVAFLAIAKAIVICLSEQCLCVDYIHVVQ